MSYRSRGKERRAKLLLIKLVHILQFQGIYLPFSAKIVLVWNILLFISLFQTWVINTSTQDSWNSFSALSWNIGYIFLLGILTIFFVLLSTNNKEKLKLHTNVSFKNHSLIWAIWIFIIFWIIISLSFIHGFEKIYQNLEYANGGIFALTSGIIILIWAYLMRIESKKHNIETFIDDQWEIREKISSKNNMTLPF
jgi:hypothetical protein